MEILSSKVVNWGIPNTIYEWTSFESRSSSLISSYNERIKIKTKSKIKIFINFPE